MKRILPFLILAAVGYVAYVYMNKKTNAAYAAGIDAGQTSILGW